MNRQPIYKSVNVTKPDNTSTTIKSVNQPLRLTNQLLMERKRLSLNIDRHLSIHTNAMILRSQRAKVLANNLANADTPGYKARDLSFKGLLNKSDNTLPMTGNNTRHINVINSNNQTPTLLYRIPTQTSHDGNTVQTDIEKGAFTENAIRYQASVQFVKNRVSGIIKAIRGE